MSMNVEGSDVGLDTCMSHPLMILSLSWLPCSRQGASPDDLAKRCRGAEGSQCTAGFYRPPGKHVFEVTLTRGRAQGSAASSCGLGIKFREDDAGRLHVAQLAEGGAGQACGKLQTGDILSDLDGVAMQVNVATIASSV